MTEYHDIEPILKWAGGKRSLLDVILPKINRSRSTYIEPFIGGGAVFFALQPDKAVINDSNLELINVYRVVRDSPDELIAKLKEHEKNDSSDYYYEVRKLDRLDDYESLNPVIRAARTIYINKTCYNGVYRVNQKNQFNMAYAHNKNPNISNELRIRQMSAFLRNPQIQICGGDYKTIVESASDDSFLYLDPPYMSNPGTSQFTRYTKDGFGYDRQTELKECCDRLRERGIPFLLSNSDCPEIRELYSGYCIETVKALRKVSCKTSTRGRVREVLISPEKKGTLF